LVFQGYLSDQKEKALNFCSYNLNVFVWVVSMESHNYFVIEVPQIKWW